jgi:hypothetical protein
LTAAYLFEAHLAQGSSSALGQSFQGRAQVQAETLTQVQASLEQFAVLLQFHQGQLKLVQTTFEKIAKYWLHYSIYQMQYS